MTTREPPEEFVALTWRRTAELEPLIEALEAAGLRYVLADDSEVRIRGSGGVGQFSGIYLFVHRDDLERAREIEQRQLRETLPDLPPEDEAAAPAGGCPACGEPLADDAAECGACGLVFPE